MGVDEWELADTPDNLASMPEEAGWEDFNG